MEIADAAYIASRVGAYDDCRGLDRQHVLDDGREREGDITVLGEWLGEAQGRYNAKVPALSRVNVNGESKVGKQGELAYKLEKCKWDAMVEGAGQLDRARLLATAATKAESTPPDNPNTTPGNLLLLT